MQRTINIILLTVFVIWIAAGFYFWEKFLFNHYLGMYDDAGLPIQQSLNGYDFFLKAWLLWGFPLLTLFLLTLFWAISFAYKKKNELRALDEARYQEEIKANALAYELKKSQGKFEQLEERASKLARQEHFQHDRELEDSQKIHKDLENSYQILEQGYLELETEYRKSLEFIERLLSKINTR